MLRLNQIKVEQRIYNNTRVLHWSTGWVALNDIQLDKYSIKNWKVSIYIFCSLIPWNFHDLKLIHSGIITVQFFLLIFHMWHFQSGTSTFAFPLFVVFIFWCFHCLFAWVIVSCYYDLPELTGNELFRLTGWWQWINFKP